MAATEHQPSLLLLSLLYKTKTIKGIYSLYTIQDSKVYQFAQRPTSLREHQTHRDARRCGYTFPLREGMAARSMPPHVHGQRPPPALRFRVTLPASPHPPLVPHSPNIPPTIPFRLLL
ncbi:jg16396 [Pararge aegeria aegeria]|uniref:Jg16396 protein n=1 Tax=Pararge aegeria aegeria TaxID=348720 RepID=A0A8S4SA82_9NEOP|nr:jg16396 [Pararge aegeria aegeria]